MGKLSYEETVICGNCQLENVSYGESSHMVKMSCRESFICGKCHMGRVSHGESAIRRKCHMGKCHMGNV